MDFNLYPGLSEALAQRRQKLSLLLPDPVLLWSGSPLPRNFAANVFPFRASSHFLYFAGLPLQDAVIHLHQGEMTLFMDAPSPEDRLWHGEMPTPSQVAEAIGASAAYPLAELRQVSTAAATLPVQDPTTRAQQSWVLGRTVEEPSLLDQALAEALVQLRLVQDEMAIAAIREAAHVSVKAHLAGMAQTRHVRSEAQVRAAIEAEMIAAEMTPAYASIVTVCGEVLHNQSYGNSLHPGQLLLVDAGAEHPLGWASDVTRTWPVSGQWTATQLAIYEVVLAAHDACIAAIRPGVEYRDIHRLAAVTLTEGLIDLGLLRGPVETLIERSAHALFFPHGVGHLLGLDVHDMEDLGDLAGYAPGRQRSDRPGLKYLRLDRPLQAGMTLTIEPGFYQVPGLINDRQTRDAFADCVNWERLAEFDVRGLRLEDDVLVTETGCEVLTSSLPIQADDVLECVNAASPVPLSV